jgi:uncharacterized membrane protein YcgQ (UPF0703/DUF1980 family)
MKCKKIEPQSGGTNTGAINEKAVTMNPRVKKRSAVLFTGVLLLSAVLTACGPGSSIGSVRRNAAGTRAVALQDSPDAKTADSKAGSTNAQAESVVEIKEKMFIAQTNDIYLNPEDYMGRTIKLEGLFKSYSSEEYDTSYCFVIRYGPGCCGNDGSAGFEIAWDDNYTLQPVYPEEDAWVEAVGVLKNYTENDYPYLYLSLSSLTVQEEKGAEFVLQ